MHTIYDTIFTAEVVINFPIHNITKIQVSTFLSSFFYIQTVYALSWFQTKGYLGVIMEAVVINFPTNKTKTKVSIFVYLQTAFMLSLSRLYLKGILERSWRHFLIDIPINTTKHKWHSHGGCKLVVLNCQVNM